MSELFYQALNQDLYGNQRTRTFAEIYPTADDFKAAYDSNPFATATNINDSEITKIYYLLYANYGNSSICSSDEYRFELPYPKVKILGKTFEDIQELIDKWLKQGSKDKISFAVEQLELAQKHIKQYVNNFDDMYDCLYAIDNQIKQLKEGK